MSTMSYINSRMHMGKLNPNRAGRDVAKTLVLAPRVASDNLIDTLLGMHAQPAISSLAQTPYLWCAVVIRGLPA